MNSRLTIGARLKALRKSKDMTQQQLATLSTIERSNIAAIETGTRPMGYKVAYKLSKVLECDFLTLLNLEENK